MAVTYIKPQEQQIKRKKCGHTRAAAPLTPLDQPGRLKVGHVLAILGISHSALYEGMASKRYPKPDGYDGRRPYWKTSTIRQLLES